MSSDTSCRLEQNLVRLAAQGKTAAFTALVERHQQAVFCHALRMLRDRAEAEDMTQEVLLALYVALRDFRGEARLSTWLYRVTRNRCLNRLQFLQRRGRGRHRPWNDGVADAFTRDGGSSPDDTAAALLRLEREDAQRLLGRALCRLPVEQRQLVLLRELEGMSYEEIAGCTGLPLGTVKSRVHRAKAALLTLLRPHASALLEFLLGDQHRSTHAGVP